MAGVEILGGILHFNDVDVVRQQIIEAVLNLARSDVRLQIGNAKMRDLGESVNARVGSACAADFRICQPRQRVPSYSISSFQVGISSKDKGERRKNE